MPRDVELLPMFAIHRRHQLCLDIVFWCYPERGTRFDMNLRAMLMANFMLDKLLYSLAGVCWMLLDSYMEHSS